MTLKNQLNDRTSEPRIVHCAGVLLYARNTGQYLATYSREEKAWGLPSNGVISDTANRQSVTFKNLQDATGYKGKFRSFAEMPANKVYMEENIWLHQHLYLYEIDMPFVCQSAEGVEYRWVNGLDQWPQPQADDIELLLKHDAGLQILKDAVTYTRSPSPKAPLNRPLRVYSDIPSESRLPPTGPQYSL
ncbi:MAG: hypothetical protein V4621_04920 [Pseudomonadota bacterium]